MYFKKMFELCRSDKHKFCTRLIDSSSPTHDFYFLITISTLIVSFGLVSNNVVLIIGGMLITPLLSPILAIALGMVILDMKVVLRSVKVFIYSFITIFAISYIVGVFTQVDTNTIDLVQKMTPSWIIFFIALIAGVAASYTWVKPELDERLPGIAITVTLVPPLTTIGLALSVGQYGIAKQSLSVFLINVFAIIISSFVIFLLLDLYETKKKVIKEIKEEEKELGVK